MAPTLVSIPPELLEKVAKSLNPEDDDSNALLALRSVSRDTRSAVHKVFVRTYFTKRSVFFMKSKLCELEDIASSAELALRVTDLEVICEPSTTKTPDWGVTFEGTARQPDFTALASPLSVLLAKFPRLATISFVKDYYATEPKDDQCPTYRWDFDATFQATMAALAMVGIQPTTMRTDMGWESLGFDKDQSWFCLLPHLDFLHRLDLSLFLDRELGVNVDKIGMNFLLALQQCTVLEELSLELGYSNEVRDAFDCLASAVLLPQLRRFAFYHTACDTPTMMRFLNNHAATLKSCKFCVLEFWRRDAADITNLLAMMRENMKLEQLDFHECSEGMATLFPDMVKVRFDSEPNDDGYIVVELDDTISLEGYNEVQSGLACMLKCVE
ncbi:hypothetical protein LTR22_011675 [Elasticomyces elasticus]|nr:hypothetical protein LTR22_011675 [Elasticomyces elasticus]KAK4918979.1 hypothetical protein LTR49_013296 [Elasticomyces elasticus]KAK5756670.1 hypothetical protein LTS12_013260 [Elasticomyces elasticus]